MSNTFYLQDIVTVQDFTRKHIDTVLNTTRSLKKYPIYHLLKDKIVASCFFEASTRTRLSFEAAVYRLGGHVIGFSDDTSTSFSKKGETLEDTIRMVESYADAIIIRHPDAGSARIAAETANKPVINAGDGANQHPTQTLLDLFTISERFGSIDGLTIGMVGDLKYGRTVHSLAKALTHFNVKIIFCPEPGLGMPEEIQQTLKEANIPYSCAEDLQSLLEVSDVIYMTRCQAERYTQGDKVSRCHTLDKQLLQTYAKETAFVMHPLPRQSELDKSIDDTSWAGYFKQAENGLYVRQAILKLLLCK